MNRDWDKARRQANAAKPLSLAQVRALQYERRSQCAAANPFSKFAKKTATRPLSRHNRGPRRNRPAQGTSKAPTKKTWWTPSYPPSADVAKALWEQYNRPLDQPQSPLVARQPNSEQPS